MKNIDEQPKPDTKSLINQIIVVDVTQPKKTTSPLLDSQYPSFNNEPAITNPNRKILSNRFKRGLSSASNWPSRFHKKPAEAAQQINNQSGNSGNVGTAVLPLNKYPHLRTIIAMITVGILLVAGAGFVVYGSGHASKSQQAQIAGVSIKNLDEVAALKKLNAVSTNQKITIGIDGKPYTFSSQELGVSRDITDIVESNFSKPQSKIEQLFIKQQKISNIKTYVNKAKLIATIESKLGQYKKPVDASLSISGESIIVNPGKAGMSIDFARISSQIVTSKMNSNITINAKLAKTEPQINTAAANVAETQAENLISKTYAVESDTSGVKYASKAQKASWLRFTNNIDTKSISVAINTAAAKGTLTQIAKSFSHGMRQKVVLTFNGAPPTVIDGGQDGTSINQNSLNTGLAQLENAINNQQSYTILLTLAVQPTTERDLGGINGGKFILVDIASFKAYAVDNNNIARTMLVSTGIPIMPTPRGHFKILLKKPMQDMTGCNPAVGCWDVPHVPNVQFFTPQGDAFHGTYWHHMEGKANLSHGCVNLTLDDAAWLYGWTVVGTDVIII